MGNYITIADIKPEGLPDGTDTNLVNRRIDKWERILEQMTRQVFRVVEPGELIFDGSNMRYLHLPMPIVQVTSLKINDMTTALDSSLYRAYTGISLPQDDRRNPKLELLPNNNSFFMQTLPGVFVKGLQQKITAKWGFVDPGSVLGTYVTPQPIKDVLVQLVLLDLDNYFDRLMADHGKVASSPVYREITDGHTIEYANQGTYRSMWTMIPNELADIIAFYRAPSKIDSPEQLKYLLSDGSLVSYTGEVI